jgi:hypothetical protein
MSSITDIATANMVIEICGTVFGVSTIIISIVWGVWLYRWRIERDQLQMQLAQANITKSQRMNALMNNSVEASGMNNSMQIISLNEPSSTMEFNQNSPTRPARKMKS